MKKTKYTAIIITLNEEDVIGETLRLINQIADEVIVVDSHSNDNTRKIATKMGAKVVDTDWKGYSATKNYGISLATHDWIFCFDADERPNLELINSIKALSPEPNTVYKMKIKTSYIGKTIQYGSWRPSWYIRLFNKHECSWNNFIVHEQLEPIHDKKIVKLHGHIEHKSITSRIHFEDKIDRYAYLKAKQWVQNNKKPSILKRIIGPQIRFITSYIIKGGFRDGKLGYQIAMGEFNLVKKQLLYFNQLKK